MLELMKKAGLKQELKEIKKVSTFKKLTEVEPLDKLITNN